MIKSNLKGKDMELPRNQIKIKPGLNIRADYGNLDELASVIDRIEQPLIGYMEDDQFIVCDGHRRLAAYDEYCCEYLIPCLVDSACETRSGQILLALRTASAKSLSMWERGNAYQSLNSEGMNLEDIAINAHIRITSVRDCIALLNTPELVQEHLQSDSISATEVLGLIKSEKENAPKVIEKAVQLAKSLGKDKATKKHIDMVKSPNYPDSDTSYVDEMIDFLDNTRDFDCVDWSVFAPSVLKKLVSQLTKN